MGGGSGGRRAEFWGDREEGGSSESKRGEARAPRAGAYLDLVDEGDDAALLNAPELDLSVLEPHGGPRQGEVARAQGTRDLEPADLALLRGGAVELHGDTLGNARLGIDRLALLGHRLLLVLWRRRGLRNEAGAQ